MTIRTVPNPGPSSTSHTHWHQNLRPLSFPLPCHSSFERRATIVCLEIAWVTTHQKHLSRRVWALDWQDFLQNTRKACFLALLGLLLDPSWKQQSPAFCRFTTSGLTTRGTRIRTTTIPAKKKSKQHYCKICIIKDRVYLMFLLSLNSYSITEFFATICCHKIIFLNK